jgi:hypothetical protein
LLSTAPVKKRLATTIGWIYTEASFFGGYALFDSPESLDLIFTTEAVRVSIQIGSLIIFILGVVMTIFKYVHQPEKTNLKRPAVYLERSPPNFRILCLSFFGTALIVSLVSNYLGISVLGGPYDVILPFKIKGILNVTRTWVIPFAVLVLLDLARQRDRPMVRWVLIFFVAWSIIEAFLRASRSTIAYSGILVAYYYGTIGRFSLKASLIACLAIITGGATFVVITNLRTSLEQAVINVDAVKAGSSFEVEDRDAVPQAVYFRQFQAGVFTAKFHDALLDKSLGDLTRVLAAGGPALFHTIDLNGIYGRQYSAGGTTFSTGYLMGGWAGVVISAILVGLLASAIDYRHLSVFTALPPAFAYTTYLFTIFLNEDLSVIVFQAQTYIPALIAIAALCIAHGKISLRLYSSK